MARRGPNIGSLTTRECTLLNAGCDHLLKPETASLEQFLEADNVVVGDAAGDHLEAFLLEIVLVVLDGRGAQEQVITP